MTITELIKELQKTLNNYGDFDIAAKEDIKILSPKIYDFIYSIPEIETVPFEVMFKVELWKYLYNL